MIYFTEQFNAAVRCTTVFKKTQPDYRIIDYPD
jgi:hypothetical protein